MSILGITGIICEYNPLHLGHKKQFSLLRENDPDGGIVCLMSGNFVQRGAPAIVGKEYRAKAAILSGADLVLELPVPVSLRSAEGFADGGVAILSGFCDRLCFGAECADTDALMQAARKLLSDEFPVLLKAQLSTGLSFPAARQRAAETLGINGSLLSEPNNILAVEYCKAILRRNSAMTPYPICRQGKYHDIAADPENPSATSVRSLLLSGDGWQCFVPPEAVCCYNGAPLHTLDAGVLAILAKLRTMPEESFSTVPYGSEGLWRKFLHAVRTCGTLEEILTACKSKRYTRTRLDRMLMCAFLGITEQQLAAPAPYTRVLALNDRGRSILRRARETGCFPNAGEILDDPYQTLEDQWGDLYGLFCTTGPERAGTEHRQRVFCQK